MFNVLVNDIFIQNIQSAGVLRLFHLFFFALHTKQLLNEWHSMQTRVHLFVCRILFHVLYVIRYEINGIPFWINPNISQCDDTKYINNCANCDLKKKNLTKISDPFVCSIENRIVLHSLCIQSSKVQRFLSKLGPHFNWCFFFFKYSFNDFFSH